MPRLADTLRNTNESAGGSYDIEPGAYVLVITKVEPVPNRSFVRLYWDVLVGERKGAYASSQWPPSDVLSWKDSAIGMYKHKLHVLADANPNRLHAIKDANGSFLSIQEAEEDRWEALVGCRFGAVVRRRLYTAGPNSKNPGADRHAMEVAAFIGIEQVDSGDFNKSLLADRDQREAKPAQQTAHVPDTYDATPSVDVYDEDIPF